MLFALIAIMVAVWLLLFIGFGRFIAESSSGQLIITESEEDGGVDYNFTLVVNRTVKVEDLLKKRRVVLTIKKGG